MAIAIPPRRRRQGWGAGAIRGLTGERAAAVAGLGAVAIVSALVGRTVASGSLRNALALAILPGLVLLFAALASERRKYLLLIALGLNFIPFVAIAHEPLVGSLYLADLVVGLAVATWAAERLAGAPGATIPRTPILGVPLVILGFALIPGLLEGAERFGTTFFGQSARLVVYAGIAAAFTRLTAKEAYRFIVVVFYIGTVLKSFAAAYYLATGGSETGSELLSTGGNRVLALSTAMYLAGALVLALLNLQLDPKRRVLHGVFAALALFGVVVAYGRTTYVALAVLLPILFVTLREMRRSILLLLPYLVPFAVVGAILIPLLAPDLIPTLTERVKPSVESDSNYVWRERAVEATLNSTADDRLLGGGFGSTQVFWIDGRQFTIGGDPHNSFVWLLAGGGVVALGAFCLLLLVYLVDALRRLLYARGVERALVGFSLALFFIFVVNTVTGPIMTSPKLLISFWTILLLPALVRARPAPDDSTASLAGESPAAGTRSASGLPNAKTP